jgi:hypothetical protein
LKCTVNGSETIVASDNYYAKVLQTIKLDDLDKEDSDSDSDLDLSSSEDNATDSSSILTPQELDKRYANQFSFLHGSTTIPIQLYLNLDPPCAGQ